MSDSEVSRLPSRPVLILLAIVAVLVVAVAVLSTVVALDSGTTTPAAAHVTVVSTTSTVRTVTVAPSSTTANSTPSAATTDTPDAAPNPATPATTDAAIYDCQHQPHVRPSNISSLFCADDGISVTGITWSDWRAKSANGFGTEDKKLCVPDCASGTTAHIPVSVSLIQPMDGGFTTIVLTQSSGATESYSLIPQ